MPVDDGWRGSGCEILGAKYLDVTTVGRVEPKASPLLSLNFGGSPLERSLDAQRILLRAFCVEGVTRAGLRVSDDSGRDGGEPDSEDGRNFNLNAMAGFRRCSVYVGPCFPGNGGTDADPLEEFGS